MEIDKRAFEGFLDALDPDRELAAEKYEEIRAKLIRFLRVRGAADPEELTDQTIDRVAEKLVKEGETIRDLERYCYGVAYYKLVESLRSRPAQLPMPERESPEAMERSSKCLEKCLNALSPENRELIVNYYKEERSAMIENRRTMAERQGITLSALRLKAYRLRLQLEDCVSKCLESE